MSMLSTFAESRGSLKTKARVVEQRFQTIEKHTHLPLNAAAVAPPALDLSSG